VQLDLEAYLFDKGGLSVYCPRGATNRIVLRWINYMEFYQKKLLKKSFREFSDGIWLSNMSFEKSNNSELYYVKKNIWNFTRKLLKRSVKKSNFLSFQVKMESDHQIYCMTGPTKRVVEVNKTIYNFTKKIIEKKS